MQAEPPLARAPQRLRSGGFEIHARPWIGWVSVAGALLLWHVAARALADPILLPAPAEVLAALAGMARSGELARDLAASLGRLAWGWGLGAAAGLILGSAVALSSVVRSAALPLVNTLFAMPKIALLPVFIVWLGIGETSKIATIAVGVFSPMAVAAAAGIDGVDRSLIRMAQSFDVPTRAILTKILLPGALPALLTGVRISASIAIVLLVGAEMIAAEHGIGALALNSGGLMRTDRMFAAVALLGLGGLILSWLLGLAERRIARWR